MGAKLQPPTTFSELGLVEPTEIFVVAGTPPVAPAPITPAGCQRLSPAQITQSLASCIQSEQVSEAAWLSINLQRSDRLHALAQYPLSKVVIAEVGRRIEKVLRSTDSYSFVSHDEVWILLRNLSSSSLAELAGRTLQQNLSHPISIDRESGSASTVSLRPVIGVTKIGHRALRDPMTVLTSAHDAMNKARSSDDHLVVVTIDEGTDLINRNRIERALRTALQGNDLDVYFQPQIDLKTRQCVAAEALVRWRQKDGSFISPALIASICEERGLMSQLTQFVLNTALRHLMAWKSSGFNINISVNLSAVTLSDSSFVTVVEHALSTWGISAERLTLELTESSIVQNEGAALEMMKQLRKLGCKLALDDFGTGYSSFAYLRQYPISELKIDQMFSKNLATDLGDQRIVHALAELAHTFEMTALAEGVEDEETAVRLLALGCDVAQGYHFSKAIPANEFLGWVKNYHAKVERDSLAL
jgi:diguanylate cyclase